MDGQAAAPRVGELTPGTEVVDLETVAHWWCRRCGRWEVCDDYSDLCIECGYMVAARSCRRPRRPRPLDADGASEVPA